jgi:hypothetical protein
LDDVDHSLFQILSLVYRRLLELGIEDPELPRIKGLHRYQWTQNQLAARGNRELLKALRREDIPTLLLQGAALGQTVYPDPAARGVHDMEVVVPVETAARAVSLLRASGWSAQYFDPAWTLEFTHACALIHPEYGNATIRWRVMVSRCVGGHEEELWNAAKPFEYDQVPTKILCAADQFLNACEHGMHHSSDLGPQWLVDCAFLIRHSPPPFDWQRLIDQSGKFQLSLHPRRALDYLRMHFEDSIPLEVIAGMARSPVTLDTRIEYFLAGRPDAKQQDLTHKFGVAACRYIRLKQGGRFRQFLRDVPRFMRLLANRAHLRPAISRKEQIGG